VDTETPRPEKLVVDFDTTVNSSPTDISGKGNHGTFNGGASYSVADKAFNFDGTDDYIKLDTGLTGNVVHSISMWVKAVADFDTGNIDVVLYWGAGGSGSHRVEVYMADDIISYNFASNDYNVTLPTNTLVNDRWYHLVFTYNGVGGASGREVYIDGVKQTGSHTGSTDVLTLANSDLYLASNFSPGGQYHFGGQISNFKLYNVALEPSEVQKLYRLGRTGRSMVISDTAVGIGKVPEAQLDVRGTARFGSIPRFHGSYSGTFDFSGDGYLPGFRMDDGCIGLHMRCILNPYGDSNGVIKIAGSRDQLGNDNTVGEYGAFTQLKGAAISVQSDLELAPDTEDAVEPILWTMDIAATGKENSFIGTTANSRYHFNYRSTGCDRGDGTRTVYGHGWFRHQSNYLSEIKLNASVGSVRGQYQIIKYY
jgi:hypothetical protein